MNHFKLLSSPEFLFIEKESDIIVSFEIETKTLRWDV